LPQREGGEMWSGVSSGDVSPKLNKNIISNYILNKTTHLLLFLSLGMPYGDPSQLSH
jgi:hypothetical protein